MVNYTRRGGKRLLTLQLPLQSLHPKGANEGVQHL